ncbi:MAG: PDZ domain-containing protein, partial [Candidatus Polarisedimenticolia bacterium]
AALAPPASPGAAAPAPRLAYESQVVVLVITTQDYDQFRPWEKKTPETRTVQAVVLEGSRLITTADLVEGATVVLAEKHGSPHREPARIVHVDADANLALLTVDAAGFFGDLKPAVLAGSVPSEGRVDTVRWSSGQLEVSASRVTRMEVGGTYLGALEHASLLLETDLTGGGWSEPVFAGGRLIGLTYSQDEQSATVTPVDILRAYLESARSPKPYREMANLELYWQVNRDPALTRHLGLPGEPRGVLVTQVPQGSSACGALLPRDLLLGLDGHPIDAAGYYEHPGHGRLKFTQIVVDGHRAGDVVPAEVLRDGRTIGVRLTLRPARSANDLIPFRSGGEPPPYVVAGGLVFRELTADFLRTWGQDWEKKAPPFLVTRYELFRTAQSPDRRRVVLLAYVLPSAYNLGYGNLQNLPVARINGRDIDSIDDVDEAFRHPGKEFHLIVLESNPVRSEILLDAATFEEATRSILEDYQVPQRIRLRPAPLPPLGDDCDGRS